MNPTDLVVQIHLMTEAEMWVFKLKDEGKYPLICISLMTPSSKNFRLTFNVIFGNK
jgi:hypothetical protein